MVMMRNAFLILLPFSPNGVFANNFVCVGEGEA